MVRSTLLVFCYLMAEMPFGSPRANVYFCQVFATTKTFWFFYKKTKYGPFSDDHDSYLPMFKF